MRFVLIKSREQQAALSLHRVRSLLIRQRTQLINMMRSVLAELGMAIPVGKATSRCWLQPVSFAVSDILRPLRNLFA